MSKREEIIDLADNLIRNKGYNAFSFYEISEKVGIKTASIHYHFPTKSDLGVAVIEQHIQNLNDLINSLEKKSPLEKLNGFFSIYANVLGENNVCLVGALATDFNTLNHKVQNELKVLSAKILDWVSEFLDEGRDNGFFDFEGKPRKKALMIISNMLAIVQISRLTHEKDFEVVKKSIKNELIKK